MSQIKTTFISRNILCKLPDTVAIMDISECDDLIWQFIVAIMGGNVW